MCFVSVCEIDREIVFMCVYMCVFVFVFVCMCVFL